MAKKDLFAVKLFFLFHFRYLNKIKCNGLLKDYISIKSFHKSFSLIVFIVLQNIYILKYILRKKSQNNDSDFYVMKSSF